MIKLLIIRCAAARNTRRAGKCYRWLTFLALLVFFSFNSAIAQNTITLSITSTSYNCVTGKITINFHLQNTDGSATPNFHSLYSVAAGASGVANQSANFTENDLTFTGDYVIGAAVKVSAYGISDNGAPYTELLFTPAAPPGPTKPTITLPTLPLCNGASGTLTANGGGGTYTWYFNGVATGHTGATYDVSAAGDYTVEETNYCGTSPLSDPVTVTTDVTPTKNTITLPTLPLCDGASGTLTASGAAGSTYKWYLNGSILPAKTTKAISVTAAGDYTVEEVNSCGTSPISDAVTVTTGTAPTKNTVSLPSLPLCNGASGTLTASGSAGSTYKWYLNGSILPGKTTKAISVTAAGDYTVEEVNSCGTSPISDAVTVTTGNDPVVAAITGPTGVCEGSTITLADATAGGTWSSSNNGIAIINSSGVVTGVAAGSVTISYAVSNTCGTTTVTYNITVNALPILAAITGPAAVCRNNTITLANSTSGGSWSSGNTSIATVDGSGNVTGVAAGSVTISYTYTNGSGCASSVTKNITVNGLPTVTISGDVSTGSVVLTASGANTYSWSSGDNTAVITKSLLSTATYNVTGTDGNGCQSNALYSVNSSPNSGATSISSSNGTTFCQGNSTTLTATAGDSYYWSTGATTQSVVVVATGTYTVYVSRNASSIIETANITITVSPTTVGGSVSGNATVCSGSNSGAVTLAGYTGTILNWEYSTNGGGSWTTIANNTTVWNYSNLVTTTLFRAIIQSGVCPSVASTAATITVNPIPTVNAVSNQINCNGTTTNAVSFSGAVGGTQFNWTNNTPSIGLAASGVNNIASFTAGNGSSSPVVATITVTPTAGGCTGSPINYTYTVNPTPNVIAVANQVNCNGTTTNAVTFSGAVGSTSFAWTNNAPTIGLAASGNGDISSFTAINNTSAPVVATVTITPSANGCTGPTGSYTYTVNPTPNVSAVSNQVLCNAATTIAVTFNGSVAGTQFNWGNDLPSIGLPGSGLGNIAAFAAANSGNTTVIATITVTPTANGCSGSSINYTYTVKPTPNVVAVANQVNCNGTTTNAVTFSGAVASTLFTWSNTTPSIGLAASGTGNIASFTASNITSSPVVATVTITPSANGCTGPTGSYTYTVNPTPNVVAVANQVNCNGTTTNAVAFTGSVASTLFSWSNTTPSIGLAASGTGNIASFTASNISSAPVVATVTITPSANGCTGPTGSYTYTVNPTPNVVAVANQINCNGTTTNAVAFTGSVASTLFTWANTTPSIGLAASGTGNIASFTASNISSAPVVATVTITPSANGCTGPTGSYTYTVNPTPNVVAVANQINCNGTTTNAVAFTGSVASTLFTWANTTPSIGLAASGNGDISSFTASNNTSSPVVATVTITPSANGCTGPTGSYTYTVNPTPLLTSTLIAPAICDSTTFSYLPTSAVVGAAFTWTRPAIVDVNGGIAGSGNNAISQVLWNDTNDDVTVSYQVTSTANTCSVTQTVTVIVHPTPLLAFLQRKKPKKIRTPVRQSPTSDISGLAE